MRLPVPELVPLDPALLERRARLLATGAAGEGTRAADHLVSFRLHGRPCAVSAGAVERAVARLSRPLAIPLLGGGERLVAFVEERPVPVVDLAGLAAGEARGAGALESGPALLVPTALGPVAVAVQGPLELLEDYLALAAAEGDPAPVRMLGLLARGAMAVDPAWLRDWAERAVRP